MLTVSSFWYGAALPSHCWLCLKSFIDHGHEFELYSYAGLDLPRGVKRRDAREILPESRVFFYRGGPGAGSVAAFANLFRYQLLSERGGWWVDTDVLCLGNDTYPFGDTVFGWETEETVGNAVLRFPPRHWLSQRLCDEAEVIYATKGADLEWGETGPTLLTRLVTENGLRHVALPSRVFYPVSYTETRSFVRAEEREAVRQRVQGSVFLHLWSEVFRRYAEVLPLPPPEGSYLASMYDRHGVRR